MKKLAPLLGFEVFKEDETSDLVIINDFCNFPQEKNNCRKIIERIERLIISNQQIVFPVKIKYFEVTIQPTIHTLRNYYSIDGIKKIVSENKEKILDKITFIKPELIYGKKMKYPKLIIHFYQIDDEGSLVIDDDELFVDYTFIYYENIKQFTNKRIDDLNLATNNNFPELENFPILPLEVVKYDNDGNILDFEHYERIKNHFKP
jgi:hypothetical protein